MDQENALSAERIQEGLNTDVVGQELVYLPETGSTNDVARRLAGEGAPDGTVVLTDHQTAGRGRLDRRWEAPPGCCLLVSFLFRPPLAAHQLQRLTMICGLAAADAIEAETGLRVALKWPNDVVLDGAKVGGILTEIGLHGPRVEQAIVGLGLNVNLDPGDLSADLLMPATSLSQALGHQVDRLSLLRSLLRAVDRRYVGLKAGHSPHAEWAARLVTLGRQVSVSTGDEVLAGVAEGVNADGALLLRLPDGRLETVLAGDVTLRLSNSDPQV